MSTIIIIRWHGWFNDDVIDVWRKCKNICFVLKLSTSLRVFVSILIKIFNRVVFRFILWLIKIINYIHKARQVGQYLMYDISRNKAI